MYQMSVNFCKFCASSDNLPIEHLAIQIEHHCSLSCKNKFKYTFHQLKTHEKFPVRLKRYTFYIEAF